MGEIQEGIRRTNDVRPPAGVSFRDAEWLVRTLTAGRTSAVNGQDVLALANALEPRRLPRGQLLYAAEALPEGVWAIRRGEVELAVGTGRRRSIMEMLRPGDIVGDVYLFLDELPPVCARASRASEAVFLSRDRLRHLLAERPQLSALWLRSACRRAVQSHRRLLELLTPGVRARVARLLLQESRDDALRMSQGAMGQMLAVGRPAVNRALRDLHREGAISLGYGRVAITDRDRLQQFAEREPVVRAELDA